MMWGGRCGRRWGQRSNQRLGVIAGSLRRMAASRTKPGAVRVVLGAEEEPFLRPLAVGLLPLPRETQMRLGYLGIRCLGQYG